MDIFEKLAAKGVVCVPGVDFEVQSADKIPSKNEIQHKNWNYTQINEGISSSTRSNSPPCIRLTFAAASPSDMEKGIKIIGETLRDLLKL